MSLSQFRTVDFGSYRNNATGSSGVGYTLLDETGTPVAMRSTAGVFQTAPGIYGAYITFPDAFRGSLVWDTGTAFTRVGYATEEYNVEANNPNVDTILNVLNVVSGTISQLYDVQYGKWEITSNQMVFYKPDNVTEIARFDLFDEYGAPSMDAVFKRVKV